MRDAQSRGSELFPIHEARRVLDGIAPRDWEREHTLLRHACDEIERLRGALLTISGYGISPNDGYPVVSADVTKRAWEALHGL